MRVQHRRLLKSSTTQHSLGSSSYEESAAVWANIYTKQWKSYHRVQSSGNGRQPWKRNDYQASKWTWQSACQSFLGSSVTLGQSCSGYLQVSEGYVQHRPKQLRECPEPSHLNRLPLHKRHSHWPSTPQCCALQLTWDLVGQTTRLTWCFISD